MAFTEIIDGYFNILETLFYYYMIMTPTLAYVLQNNHYFYMQLIINLKRSLTYLYLTHSQAVLTTVQSIQYYGFLPHLLFFVILLLTALLFSMVIPTFLS